MTSRWFIFIGISIEVISIIVTIGSAWAVWEAEADIALVEAQQEQGVFERRIDRGMQAASNRLKTYEYALKSGAGLFNASDSVDRKEWQRFVSTLNIDENYPGISGFGYIRNIPANTFDTFTQEAQQNFAPHFKVKTLGEVPDGNRYIIDYIEPIDRNAPAQGLDIGSNPIRREAADLAMNTGTAQVTRIIHLVQDAQSKPGFLMLYPTYKGGKVPDAIRERRRLLTGWTYAPFVGEEIMAGIRDIAGPGMSFNIYDGEASDDNLIYKGITNPSEGVSASRNINMGERQWIYRWNSLDLDEYGNQHSNEQPDDIGIWVVLSGLFTSTALLIVMLLLHRSNKMAMAKAKEALLAKSQFLSMMSHEIRTPLHGVIGMSEQLMDEDLEPNSKDMVATVHQSGQTLLNLVNDILDFSKIEQNKLNLEVRAFSPCETVQRVIDLFKVQANNSVQIHYRHPEKQCWAMGDDLRFGQIATNLLSNAIKFTEKGMVTVELQSRNDAFVLSIQDSGIGMSQEYLRHLFRPFQQEDGSITRRFGGSGLGLSIVKGLVDAMGGNIEVTSLLGKGSTFTVSLPLPQCEPPSLSCSLPQKVNHFDLDILLAEDNFVNQKVAIKILESVGCRVTVANNGKEALQHIEDDSKHFDLILMDCRMPVMDGYEATHRIRARGKTLPIFAFSANVGEDEQSMANDVGMDGFLTKPLIRDELYALLTQVTPPQS